MKKLILGTIQKQKNRLNYYIDAFIYLECSIRFFYF